MLIKLPITQYPIFNFLLFIHKNTNFCKFSQYELIFINLKINLKCHKNDFHKNILLVISLNNSNTFYYLELILGKCNYFSTFNC